MATSFSSPTRIDLLGGTLDIWPIYAMVPAYATINYAVDLRAYVTISPSSYKNEFEIISHDQNIRVVLPYKALLASPSLPWVTQLIHSFYGANDKPLKIEINCLSPKGSGVGGSSSLGICLASALEVIREDKDISHLRPYSIIKQVSGEEARHINAPTGIQDYYPACFGGLQILTYEKGEIIHETMNQPDLLNLMSYQIIYHCHDTRASAVTNWSMVKSFFESSVTRKKIEAIGQISHEAVSSAKKQNWYDLIQLSMNEWSIRRSLVEGIETPATQKIASAATSAGAWGSRVLGAGGGGFMVVLCDPAKKSQITEELKSKGLIPTPCPMSLTGVRLEPTSSIQHSRLRISNDPALKTVREMEH